MSDTNTRTFRCPLTWVNAEDAGICIGNIIKDVKEPHICISRGNPSDFEIETIEDTPWSLTLGPEDNQEFEGTAFGGIRGTLNAEVATTIRLKTKPTEEYIEERCDEDDVDEYLTDGPVYMIIGIKVASGLTVTGEGSGTPKSIEASNSATNKGDVLIGCEVVEIVRLPVEYEFQPVTRESMERKLGVPLQSFVLVDDQGNEVQEICIAPRNHRRPYSMTALTKVGILASLSFIVLFKWST